ncbi:RNA polymerase sigma factor [Marinilabiliaceae bacterium ANBcel2]|nr:RNA polymerase sigma factor [Marinilabiliaceae bacterium ANBcel2]
MRKKKRNKEEETLIKKIKRGDTSAFAQIAEKYKDVSFSLACSIIGDKAAAEDALQEAFIKVYYNLAKFRGEASFSSWLYRIVINTCYSAKRKYSKEIIDSDPYRCQSEDQLKYQTYEDKYFTNERTQIIDSVLNQMKYDEALLLRLYYLLELNIKEIEEVTGYKSSKIKVTLLRARKNLKQLLKKSLGNEIESLF